MKIYVDYDDCLCETARAFTGLAERLFGKRVPYEEVRFFNLQESFGLTDEEYELLMTEGHREEVILSYETEKVQNLFKLLMGEVETRKRAKITAGEVIIFENYEILVEGWD